ncbi:MAG: alpha-glucosidase [Bacillota bacterium]
MNKFIIGNLAITFFDGLIRIVEIDSDKELAILDLRKFGGVISEIDPIENVGSIVLNRTVKSVTLSSGEITGGQEGNVINFAGVFKDEDCSPWKLSLIVSDKKVSFDFENEKYSELQVMFKSNVEEKIFGFGEQFSNVEFSGKKIELCTKEQGIGRGIMPLSLLIEKFGGKGVAGDEFSTYAPMPVFLTSEFRGVSFTNTTIYHFDVKASKKNEIYAHIMASNAHFDMYFECEPLALMQSMTADTGRLRHLPDFAYDSILGIRGGRKVVDDALASCISHNAPVRAIWIEDWQGRRGKNGGPPLWWRWFPDEVLYPDFKNWASELKSRDIALLGYANPFLSLDAEKNPLYVEALEKDFLVRNLEGDVWTNHFATDKEIKYVHVDLTNPDAYAWLKEKMKVGMIGSGLSGWMADYGEYLPLKSQTYHKNTFETHAMIPVLWAKLNYELLAETGNLGKFLIFHRSAGAGSNKYATAYWAGDQNPTFDAYDGLASSVAGLISSGLSGMSINHTDIGGFTTIITKYFKLVRSKEVMFRWLEFAAFTPVFRTHDGAFANPLNYQFYYDDEGYAFYAKMGRLHSALKWYNKLCENEAVEKGIPMVRSLWLHYSDDEICKTLKHQYLLGRDILVAPVCKKRAKNVKAYLPKGNWICPYTGTVYSGEKYIKIPAKLGFPPVLIRAESEISAKIIQSISDGLK